MTSPERYVLSGNYAGYDVYDDTNLSRKVRFHPIDMPQLSALRARLAALQQIRSPYVALIYDMITRQNGIREVVEEDLPDQTITTDANRLTRLYQLSAGLSALHLAGIAHGQLSASSFRQRSDSLFPRLCNLSFKGDTLDDPTIDYLPLRRLMLEMGASLVEDVQLQQIIQSLAAHRLILPKTIVQNIKQRLAALLLKDKHRALLFWRDSSYELGAANRHMMFRHADPTIAAVGIAYDGTRFYIHESTGEVLVNNRTVVAGEDLPASCVIALGGPTRSPAMRYFITFDQSHPEVLA